MTLQNIIVTLSLNTSPFSIGSAQWQNGTEGVYCNYCFPQYCFCILVALKYPKLQTCDTTKWPCQRNLFTYVDPVTRSTRHRLCNTWHAACPLTKNLKLVDRMVTGPENLDNRTTIHITDHPTWSQQWTSSHLSLIEEQLQRYRLFLHLSR